jgi:hypothetical protein
MQQKLVLKQQTNRLNTRNKNLMRVLLVLLILIQPKTAYLLPKVIWYKVSTIIFLN